MQKPKLLVRLRIALRSLNYALSTEKCYVSWVRHFILFHNKRHPEEMGHIEVGEFLSYLAVVKNVSPATQNQALCSIIFLYKHVLKSPLTEEINMRWAKRQEHIPVVLSVNEILNLLSQFYGLPKLMASLCYGAGLRKMECHRLRIKDIDFDRMEITVRQGKGKKDRRVPLPEACVDDLKVQLAFVRELYNKDRLENLPGVELPYAFGRKYPNAGTSLAWQ